MKGLRNKVILSGIVLLFAFIATIGSTYAWFTVSTSASVDTLQLSVQAAENLLIKPYEANDEVVGVTSDLDDDGIPDILQDVNNYYTGLDDELMRSFGYLETEDTENPEVTYHGDYLQVQLLILLMLKLMVKH